MVLYYFFYVRCVLIYKKKCNFIPQNIFVPIPFHKINAEKSPFKDFPA